MASKSTSNDQIKKRKGKGKGKRNGQEPPKLVIDALLECYNSGSYNQAEIQAVDIVQMYPNHPFGWKALGIILARTGRLKESLDPLGRAVLLNPDDPAAQSNLGNALKDMGYFEEAEQRYRKAIILKPDFVQAHINLGLTLRNLRNLDAAEACYRRALLLNPANAEIYNNLGIVLRELGRCEEAEVCYQQAISLKPDSDAYYSNLGNVLWDLRRYSEAEDSYRKALEFKKSAAVYSNLGNVLADQKLWQEAEDSYQRAIHLDPNFVEAHSNLGNLYRIRGSWAAAEESYRKALRLRPDFAEGHNNLANVLRDQGRFSESEESYRKAVQLKPEYAEGHSNLGNLLRDLKRYDEAEKSCREAVRLIPSLAEAHSNLGSVLLDLGRLKEAEASYREAIALKPNFAEAMNNLGNALRCLNRFNEAEASYARAILSKPTYAEAHSNLGNLLRDLGRIKEAEECYLEAIRIKPNLAELHNNLANAIWDLGRNEDAEASCREALRLKPNFTEAHSNLLFLLNYDPNRSADDIFKEYQDYGELVSGLNLRKFTHIAKDFSKKIKLRVGYFSPDFRQHACRFFIEPLLRYRNKESFELFAYSNCTPDEFTYDLQKYFDKWVDVRNLSDDEMAQRIYDDRVDILVDLSGHTRGNRFLVFAMKPAPIQVTYPVGTGYTSGLREIDYILGDHNLIPSNSDHLFSEEVWRLSAPIFCYTRPDWAPELNDLPALKNGYITFGSMSRPIRFNDNLFLVWRAILERVPKSILRLDQRMYSTEPSKGVILNRLESLGFPLDRVQLANSNPHWSGYYEVDIALDCFPHNAGTTTWESLWMGVPVISKLDRPSLGCIGAAILRPLGLDEWIALDTKSYIEKAVEFSSDLPRLVELRATLRSRIERSPLMDANGLVRKIEHAFVHMIGNKQSASRE
jgi:predicted O-linked N-acetylglucosamine transferase (SPINDLY family)